MSRLVYRSTNKTVIAVASEMMGTKSCFFQLSCVTLSNASIGFYISVSYVRTSCASLSSVSGYRDCSHRFRNLADASAHAPDSEHNGWTLMPVIRHCKN